MMLEKLKAIKATLQTLNVTTTEDNLTKLLGCIQTLTELIERA